MQARPAIKSLWHKQSRTKHAGCASQREPLMQGSSTHKQATLSMQRGSCAMQLYWLPVSVPVAGVQRRPYSAVPSETGNRPQQHRMPSSGCRGCMQAQSRAAALQPQSCCVLPNLHLWLQVLGHLEAEQHAEGVASSVAGRAASRPVKA